MKNNHATGLVGILLVVAGFLTQPQFSTAITAILPAAQAQVISAAIVLVGAAAAYFGRPVTVPSSPTQTITVQPATPAIVEEKKTL